MLQGNRLRSQLQFVTVHIQSLLDRLGGHLVSRLLSSRIGRFHQVVGGRLQIETEPVLKLFASLIFCREHLKGVLHALSRVSRGHLLVILQLCCFIEQLLRLHSQIHDAYFIGFRFDCGRIRSLFHLNNRLRQRQLFVSLLDERDLSQLGFLFLRRDLLHHLYERQSRDCRAYSYHNLSEDRSHQGDIDFL